MLIMLFTLVVVGVTAYIWCTRGFFSSLVHMVCVIAAGAVAFGLWEPVSYFLINNLPERGFGSALGDMAWGLGLALPFAITLAILRGVIDKLLPFNAQCEGPVDYIGGAVCGVVSGVISGGIMVLSIGFLRLEPDFGGYQPVVFTSSGARGSIERAPGSLMSPWVDRITANLYSKLSLTTLRTDEPLAKWHPDFDTLPGAMRLTYEGKNRITARPDSFSLKNWYIVGDPQHPAKFDDLLVDRSSDVPQKVSDLRGRGFGSGAEAPQTEDEADLSKGYLAGFTLKFNSKAREKTGQVVIGNGQVRLVVISDQSDDQTMALHPIAVVTNVEDPTQTAYAHFRINADSTFTSSVGGSSEAVMAFEFPVPAGYKPLALYVKGVRVDLSEREKPSKVYPTPGDRDEAIDTGTMAEMTDVGPKLDENGKPVKGPDVIAIDPATLMVVGNSLGMSMTIQKGSEGSLDVTKEGRTWAITRGEEKYSISKMKNMLGVDPALKIDKFATDESTTIVKVVVTPASQSAEFNKLWEGADRNAEPAVLDKNGTRYPAAGWTYKDSSFFWVRYDRGSPVQKMTELPAVSRSASNRELTLIFVVSAGVEITEFRLGDTTLFTPKKPLKADAPARR